MDIWLLCAILVVPIVWVTLTSPWFVKKKVLLFHSLQIWRTWHNDICILNSNVSYIFEGLVNSSNREWMSSGNNQPSFTKSVFAYKYPSIYRWQSLDLQKPGRQFTEKIVCLRKGLDIKFSTVSRLRRARVVRSVCESTGLPPMWPGIKSRHRCHMGLICCRFSSLLPEVSSPGTPVSSAYP